MYKQNIQTSTDNMYHFLLFIFTICAGTTLNLNSLYSFFSHYIESKKTFVQEH